MGPARILMYSHDTYGLGHLTRTVRIARALRARHPQTSILILSGSPVAAYVPLPAGTDLVKLPSVVKSGPDAYRARDLEIRFSQIKRLRRDLILGTAEAFRPHVFMVDNVPLGMKGEVLPALRALRSVRPRPLVALNLRDILDDPRVIREHWARDGTDETLADHYDRIFVLGDASLHDAAAAYGLPPEKTTHVGYASPIPRRPVIQPRPAGHAPRILLTAGGGGDGADLMRTAVEGLGRVAGTMASNGGPGIRIEVITGPLMDPEQRKTIGSLCDRLGAGFHEFVPDLPSRIGEADLTVAMAGYNTCCEILAHARRALVVPRTYPRMEQYIRARLFQERGIVRMIEPAAFDPAGVAAVVERMLERRDSIDAARLPSLDGLARLAEILGREEPSLRARNGGTRAPAPLPGTTGEERRAESVASPLSFATLRGIAPFWSARASLSSGAGDQG